MKKNLLILSLVGMATVLSAESKSFDGYSYGGVGFENTTYQESGHSSKIGSIKSKASGTSPVYTTGSLVRVNDRYDFSLDFSSTLLPSKISEEWTGLNGTLQRNDYDLLANSATLLVHYKLTPQHRIVAGPIYALNTFKRYNWVAVDPIIDTPVGVIEERSASVSGAIGYWYESKTAGIEGWRFKGNTLLSLPLWQQTTNTSSKEDVVFNNIGGYNADVSVYAGYTLFKGLEVGAFAGYNHQRRNGGHQMDKLGNNVTWPENTLTTYRAGLNAIWHFRD
jgi:hypothetical protein